MSKYVSDVFDIDKEVAEHGKKIMLIAGVGSGKSTWVKEVLTQKGSVLFITSRKAKVEEDTKSSCFSELFKWYTNNNQTLVTNAKLSSLVERITKDYEKDLDEFINHFDYIVIDEVHSIATDSLFAPSCTGVLSFIEYAVRMGKIVVAMTGTPEPIIPYFENEEWYIVDYRKICKCVHPKTLNLTTTKSVFSIIHKQMDVNKIIYFANRTNTMIDLCKNLLEKGIAKPEEIGLIVSRGIEENFFGKLSEKVEEDVYDILYNKSQELYEHIVSESMIPEGIKIMFSTSTLREGVDITNDNVVMICENHILSNLIQFFGRARCNNCEVHVIENVAEHRSDSNELLYKYGCAVEVESANDFLRNEIDVKHNPFVELEKEYFIRYKQSNPYIYFDYIENKFKIFHLKYNEEIRLKQEVQLWKDKLISYCHENNIGFLGNKDMKSTMQEALFRMAKSEKIVFGSEEKKGVLNALKWAYGIKAKQYTKINQELEILNVPIEIVAGKKNTRDKRDVSYWQIRFKKS